MQINVIEYLENCLNTFSDKIAIIDGERLITFSELAAKSKLKAQYLIEKRNILNQPVAVFLPKSIESLIANLAVTYSGNIYMNLDIKNPDTRIGNILEKIKPAIIITDDNYYDRISSIAPADALIVTINKDEVINDNLDEDKLFKRLRGLIDTDPYCIINTSGSTGTPKGVVLNHKSFIDFTEWAIEKFSFENNLIIGSLSPLYFDIYSFELCLLMSKGATIVVLSEQLAIFPAKLLDLLINSKINFIFWVPTIMVNIANMDLLSTYKLKDLKRIWFAGEVFPTKHLNYWRKNLTQAMFVNLYGPIEITLDCTYYIVEKEFPDNKPIPIGYPCKNTDVLILNDEEKLAMANEKGELCVRGTSLAMGYYNDTEKTAKAFTQNPLNHSYPELIYRTGDVVYKNDIGEIIFVGRKDFQVKHLGYRIDMSEIEHVVVNAWGKIPNACVIYNHEKKEICLFYEGGTDVSPAYFRTELIKLLPKYMIPTHYRAFKEMPRNPNGKIDRNLLATYLKDEANN